ncbi:MAG: helix-hairpin-helix domain-containing protein [Anaerolineae bacterium]
MKVTNKEIAEKLEEIARLLEIQDANPFRVRAYRDGAETVRSADRPLADLLREEGSDALENLSGIGSSLAGVITEIIHQGRSSLLERLRGEITPEKVFLQVPGIGEELAERIVEHLNVATLEELEQAAHDGRLASVPGFGEERVRNVQVSLAGMLSAAAQRHTRELERGAEPQVPEPDVGLLLEVDRVYRQRAQAGELRKIAPKRFNPEGEAWLPVMNIERQSWQFTALYSNTKRAHELGKTRDWVVIYYQHNGEEDQVTVVTETHGPMEGKRVVRGREDECRRYYKGRKGN